MGQIADDITDGTICSLCSCFFIGDKEGECYTHGYPVLCWDCWNELSKKERKQYQRALKPSL